MEPVPQGPHDCLMGTGPRRRVRALGSPPPLLQMVTSGPGCPDVPSAELSTSGGDHSPVSILVEATPSCVGCDGLKGPVAPLAFDPHVLHLAPGGGQEQGPRAPRAARALVSRVEVLLWGAQGGPG